MQSPKLLSPFRAHGACGAFHGWPSLQSRFKGCNGLTETVPAGGIPLNSGPRQVSDRIMAGSEDDWVEALHGNLRGLLDSKKIPKNDEVKG